MATSATEAEAQSAVLGNVKSVLRALAHNPSPTLPSPPEQKKRASVALVLRINPRYSHWPPQTDQSSFLQLNRGPSDQLEAFFAQEWVRHGDPEVLFIKRASRSGDRWSGHIALPGGRRDPEDEDDKQTAIREAMEEVGIDLSEGSTVHVGNLPQTLITTSFGRVPIMVLCPYVFLVTQHSIPPLRLQPTEVASAHWVSLRVLLSSSVRTYEYQDVANRLAAQEFGIKKHLLQATLGKMLFSAVQLVPSESTFSSSIPGFVPEPKETSAWSLFHVTRQWITGGRSDPVPGHPLLLWGLTQGVLADFLELLPPHNALQLWRYPTFTPPDVRFIIWALSYRFRREKRRTLYKAFGKTPASVELGLDIMPKPRERRDSFGADAGRAQEYETHASRVNFMLEGYYEIIRRGVGVALAARVMVLLTGFAYAWRKYRLRSPK